MKSILMFLCLMMAQCGSQSHSELKTTIAARHLIKSPRDFYSLDLESISSDALTMNHKFQRDISWVLWEDLLSKIKIGESGSIYLFQSWYATDDIKRIFRHLYSKIPSSERSSHQTFTEDEIFRAEQWHNQAIWEQAHWTEARFKQWLEEFQTPDQFISLPGIERVLFNSHYLQHILKNYRLIIDCPQGAAEPCLPPFPQGTAIIKTAWQRQGPGFPLMHYVVDQNSLPDILMPNKSWQGHPSTFAPEGLIKMTNLSHSTFYLTGIHLSAKTHEHWLWSSLWWDPLQSPLGQDRPASLSSYHYQMCSVASYNQQDLRHNFSDASLLGFYNAFSTLDHTQTWCSNPYIEHGKNNQKTNCLGCHQYAGEISRSQDITEILNNDPTQLISQYRTSFQSDYTWSLFFGANNIQRQMQQVVSYFQTYPTY
ncbi:hypothetical protein [Pseudobacteriovorax antillogorgiicola]|uniref:Cytochrome c domain-containing protein n=1 Tax=Pseudobacteriovorax antillogorgiicola TaxID=1513793 RepID=A0A1Y6BX20_9BACT|nr:hypothetical protein [Pseudobacteriovorax antillogorgiicola]TCS53760.1 hypothetical protein EDD56_10769 [Pseudobacteriovorax antillogorgiicola]SMF22520.1 hypothetical protein SAMN06296036_107203 [Pseudobacteriovorax antillogorgiicola]